MKPRYWYIHRTLRSKFEFMYVQSDGHQRFILMTNLLKVRVDDFYASDIVCRIFRLALT